MLHARQHVGSQLHHRAYTRNKGFTIQHHDGSTDYIRQCLFSYVNFGPLSRCINCTRMFVTSPPWRSSEDGDVSGEKQLLFSAGGSIPAGALCALMGPSDSGETNREPSTVLSLRLLGLVCCCLSSVVKSIPIFGSGHQRTDPLPLRSRRQEHAPGCPQRAAVSGTVRGDGVLRGKARRRQPGECAHLVFRFFLSYV